MSEPLGTCENFNSPHFKYPGVTCTNWQPLPPAAQPAVEGTMTAEQFRETLAKALWEAEIAEENLRGNKKDWAPWPEDAAIQPYCRSTYRVADLILPTIEAFASRKLAEARVAEYEDTIIEQCCRLQDLRKALAEANAEIERLQDEFARANQRMVAAESELSRLRGETK